MSGSASPRTLAPDSLALVRATEADAPVLANLLELYAYDFSAFHPVALREDGRFGYAALPLYWTEPDRHAFLLRIGGQLAGFALIKRGSDLTGDADAWDMAEFFLLRSYRRSGFGAAAAALLWAQFPGRWEVRVMPGHPYAAAFWAAAIAAATGAPAEAESFTTEHSLWKLFRFSIPAAR